MTTEYLDIVTRVQGAIQGAADLAKIEGAIDRISTKAPGLKTKLGGFASRAGGFLAQTGLGYAALNAAGSIGSDIAASSNAGTQGATGILGNVGGSAASGAAAGAIAGPVGALAGAAVGAAVGIGKSAVEIGDSASKLADSVVAKGETGLEGKSLDELNSGIAAIDKGIADIMANPLTYFLGGGDAAKKLADLKAEYEKQRDAIQQEGSDTERALRDNANRIVGAINGLDLSVNVSVPVRLSVAEGGTVSSVSYAAGITSTNSYRGDPGYGR